ncbi:MAG: hypothetical protein ACYYK0_01075 [Candidatus Eutrophobiaceae bacterium]
MYYISDLPSDLHWRRDVALISAASFLLCIVSTILPSLRTAAIQPAEALRHE